MLADSTHGNDAPPDVGERYATAINARSLVVVEHRASAVDILAAAAWSETRIGAQFLRLHSEFDGGQRARQAVHVGKDGEQVVPTDTKLLAMRLKSMRAAREQLTIRAAQWDIADAQAKAQAVINWWLDRRCPTCCGRRWKTIKGTPSLSGQVCGACGGHGELRIPHGQEGRKLANFIDDCLSRARQSIKQRLRGR